ncbi:MAG TPA: PAS domain-containing sensor histidine kinase [Treponema sp.]|nr:PAS domain-containing sensor histidine kinase [Treponema sp.]
MSDFYRKASKKINKLPAEQLKELLDSAAGRKSLLETVLDSLPDGILVCDDRHCLIMANKCAQRMFPLNNIESEKIPLWMAVRDERVVEFFEETLLSGDKVLEREIDIDMQGRNRLLSVSILPLVQNHRITGSLIYLEDITEKRGREARLRRVENLASLTTMAAGVAHEIKNPLGSISIHLQLLQKAIDKKHDTPEQEKAVKAQLDKYLSVLNEEVDRLNHIVVDFLFAVRPISLELREGNINTLIEELTSFVRVELEQSRIECALELDENISPVLMDERYLKQALLNLIKNAQAAMPGGGQLTIKTQAAENEVKISVIDDGLGISAENISKIFEPYFTTKDTGTGLGLTIVFKIIREHRGEINVQSRAGKGSSFTITLPAIQKQQRLISWIDSASGCDEAEGARQ